MSAWIMRLAGVSLLCAAAMALAPDGTAKKALKTVCAFAVASAIFSFSGGFDWQSYALHLEEYRQQGELLAQSGNSSTQDATRLVIQRQCEAYILDKAQALGVIDPECSVVAVWSTQGYWVPRTCSLSGRFTDEQRRQMAAWIEANMGIPEQQQSYTQEDIS